MTLVDLGKRLLESAKLGETEEVRVLMSNGAPFTTDWLGLSPLHMAAQYGHHATAEVLLRAGISKDARTKVDRTPLHIAAQEGHLEIVEILIIHGAEIDAKDMLKMTPLHWAVERGHMKVISCLLKHNADLDSFNKFYKTPLDIAKYNRQKEILQVLELHAMKTAKESPPVEKKKLPAVSSAKNKTVMIAATSGSPVVNVHKSATTTSVTSVGNMYKSTNNPTIVTATATTPTSSINAKKSPHRPILLPANLTHIQKAATEASIAESETAKTASSDSEEGDSSDQSCTNVLATLAALAEATAPNATLSTTEALQWLETHGITMLPTDNSTVVASAIESGHTVALTDAGKLALTWVKEQQSFSSTTELSSSSVHEEADSSHLGNSTNNLAQKVITIVADPSHIPSIVSQQAPIVVMGSQGIQSPGVKLSDGPPLKRIKTIIPKRESAKTVTNGKVTNSETAAEAERSKLQKELDKTRKEAELYKIQLLLKAREAEQYRKQLEEMRNVSSQNNQQ